MRDGRWDCQNNQILGLSLMSTEVSGCSHKHHHLPVYLGGFQSLLVNAYFHKKVLLGLQCRINDDFAEGHYLYNNIKAMYKVLE